ncbi:MAG: murein L,D-transpeptidase catalytic domain family protein [Porticoccaceae bacterium]
MPAKRLIKLLGKFFAITLPLAQATTASASSFDSDLYTSLAAIAPELSRTVLKTALKATNCAVSHGTAEPRRLAIIDYSLPSTEKRLWIFDLQQRALLLQELVAHGRNSGELSATAFSNTLGSYQSSLGLFVGDESYSGKHGYSLRLDGLEAGVNDLARERAIVIHGADYVDPGWIDEHGRIGRSLGCPAVPRDAAQQVVDNLKDGQLIFTYYPDQEWLNSSSYLNCDTPRVAAKH